MELNIFCTDKFILCAKGHEKLFFKIDSIIQSQLNNTPVPVRVVIAFVVELPGIAVEETCRQIFSQSIAYFRP